MKTILAALLAVCMVFAMPNIASADEPYVPTTGTGTEADPMVWDMGPTVPYAQAVPAGEKVYVLAYGMGDYVTASHYFTTYFNTYPRGIYAETARFMSARALYLDTPDPRLDQTSTIKAIGEIQVFTEYYPYSPYKERAHDMLYELHDRLVEKEYRSAQLYYDLGNYMGNNYLSCIITAQNALNDYPYTKLREDLSMLVLRARYSMAKESVAEKMIDRYRDTEDEYYAFKNEFPESKYMKEADKIFRETKKALNK